MKHTNRLVRHYVNQALQGQQIALDGRSANYLTATLRLSVGAQVVLFNGAGVERWATIAALGRGRVDMELGEATQVQAPSPLTIHLIQALAKGDAMDTAVQKATELGVARILPVTTQYSVVKLSEERRQRRLAHWQNVAYSACEQCGRHYPPLIDALLPLTDCLAGLTVAGPRVLLDPSGHKPLSDLVPGRPGEVTLLIGPEGGLSTTDCAIAAEHGFEAYSLGPRILRTETAAMAACALLQSRAGDLGALSLHSA